MIKLINLIQKMISAGAILFCLAVISCSINNDSKPITSPLIIEECEVKENQLLYQMPSYFSSFVIENERIIWIGSDAGLFKWDNETKTLFHYQTPNCPMLDNGIISLLLTENKELLILSRQGFTIFDINSGKWENENLINIGFDIEIRRGIIEIEKEYWFAADKGILRVNKITRDYSFMEFNEADGCGNVLELRKLDNKEILVKTDNSSYDYLPGSKECIYQVNTDGKWIKIDSNYEKKICYKDLLFFQDDVANYIKVRSTTPGVSENRYGTDLSQDFEVYGDYLYILNDNNIQVIDFEREKEIFKIDLINEYPELNSIQNIFQDSKKRLWIITISNSLAMFDGSNWYQWKDLSSSDGILDMIESRDGFYIISNDSKELLIFNEHNYSWNRMDSQEKFCKGMVLDSNGMLVVPSERRINSIESNEVIDTYEFQDPYKRIDFNQVKDYQLTSHYYWMISGNSLLKIDLQNGQLLEMTFPDCSGCNLSTFTDIELAVDGSMFISNEHVIMLLPQPIESTYFEIVYEIQKDDLIKNITSDKFGNLWILTKSKLLVKDNAMETIYEINGKVMNIKLQEILKVVYDNKYDQFYLILSNGFLNISSDILISFIERLN